MTLHGSFLRAVSVSSTEPRFPPGVHHPCARAAAGGFPEGDPAAGGLAGGRRCFIPKASVSPTLEPLLVFAGGRCCRMCPCAFVSLAAGWASNH